MPSPKSHRKAPVEGWRRGKLAERQSSFHGEIPEKVSNQLRRPCTAPDLLSCKTAVSVSVSPPSMSPPEKLQPRQPSKLLLNVTIQGSLGPVQVLMTQTDTVGDLVANTVRMYVKEGRRPILPTSDPSGFDLHYSQFSLESLSREEKLVKLGSRNFFLCQAKVGGVSGGGGVTTPLAPSCSKEAEKATNPKRGFPWIKFML